MQDQSTLAARSNSKKLRVSMTDAEKRIRSRLRGEQLGVKFRRQHPFGAYVADFACLEPELIVEIDGSQHLEQLRADSRRDRFFADHGFVTLRFWSNEVFENIEGVVERIAEAVRLAPSLTLRPQATPIPRAPTLTLPQRGREIHDVEPAQETEP